MRRIVYTDQRGALCVVQPVFNRVGDKVFEAPGFTEADAEKRAWDRLAEDIRSGYVVAATPPRWVEATEIPADRAFRGAWRDDGAAVSHDMAKVLEIAHERRRAAREAEFAPHDALLAKRIPGTDEAAIEAERQAIRDKYAALQREIDEAKTVDDVKAILDGGSA